MSQYDAVAADFEEHAEDSPYNAYDDRPAGLGIIDGLIGDLGGKHVLDVGCGPGLYATELLDRGAVVTGFDQSAEMVELAQRRLGPDVALRVHDADEPLAWANDDSFDLAVMTLVLHHLERPEVALAELHRGLRPGARLVVSTVHPTLDWRNLGGSYFADEFVEETWRGNCYVRYRRRPLDAWCADFYGAGLMIERLVETWPVSAMQERDPEHFARLMGPRGWTTESVESAVRNPAATHSIWDYTTGDKLPATAYVQRGGGHVVVNDSTGEIVQVSALTNPNWKPVWNDPRFQR